MSKAMALDPDNVETLLSRAVIHLWPQPPEVMAEQKDLLDTVIAREPENPKAWYHLGWWYSKLPEPDMEKSFAAFEKALEYDPFNARIVGALLEQYRISGNQKEVTRLNQLLVQIIPTTAEQRHLARISGWRVFNRFLSNHLESADPVYLQQAENFLRERREGFESDISYDLAWMELARVIGDKKTIVELASKYTLPEYGLVRHQYIWKPELKYPFALLNVHLNQENTEAAEALARQIIEAQKISEVRDQIESGSYDLLVLCAAQATLGDRPAVRKSLDQRRELQGDDYERSYFYIMALSFLDRQQAVDLALAEIQNTQAWRRFNVMVTSADLWAHYPIEHRRFLLDPRIMDYYQKQGKWMDHLKRCIPEYAELD